MINVAKLLKDAPKGMKLYSPLFGEVKFLAVDSADLTIVVETERETHEWFSAYGKYKVMKSHLLYSGAECLLFPSKEVRTWEGWKASKPHYDISNFKPFDKILGRNCCRIGVWRADLFSHIHKNGKLFVGIGYTWEQCIPFNDDTKHLLGTTDMPDECYINW